MRVRWAGDGNSAAEPFSTRQDAWQDSTTAIEELPSLPGDHRTTTPSPEEDGDAPNWTSSLNDYLGYFSHQHAQAKVARGRASEQSFELSSIWGFVWEHVSHQVRRSSDLDAGGHNLLYSKALQDVNGAVENGDILAIFGITTLAFLDVREGPFGRWEQHLRGARALLDLHCPGIEDLQKLYADTPGLKQAISLLNWYDVMGVIIHQDRRLLFEDFHRQDMHPDLFQLVGCPEDTYFLYVRIAQGQMISRPHQIHHSVTAQIMKGSPSSFDDISLLADAWRYTTFFAALVYLQFDSTWTDETSNLVADRICDILERIQPRDMVYVHLPVTMFFMVIYASTERHMAVATRSWAYFEQESLPSYPNAQAMCQARRRERLQQRRNS
ncbi:uncharacterized protein HMPREF1541_02235 [Cyphellophora europaea CBS 101466]|uniref:Transcription factor domain-containing protein n=1 Tax=Cyphellophora europaea (strain CBS 101466) TaxID=1220924 RepID=W2S308_CYPE1|nr:uncharacterized protein HMPREF1541_02235 [Cyphellophora europaea CBS 101466]ETN43077.1 hypothetical protein HMPREF1541_02235 [Cyphellophora europaea CBS 101466]